MFVHRQSLAARISSCGLSFEPILCVVCPGRVGISTMKQIKRRFGPAAGVLVCATVTRRSYRQVERLRRARIVRVLLGPIDRHAAEIIWCAAERLKGSKLARSDRLTCFEKFRRDNCSLLILLLGIFF